jgi:membrane protein
MMKSWRKYASSCAQAIYGAYLRFDRHHIPAVAAGATFFVLLALFPAFASIVTLYGFLADRSTIARELSAISAFLPRGAIVVLTADLNRLIAQKSQEVGLTFLGSTVVALWSASGGLKALVDGLNIAYEVEETRGLVKRSLIALLLTGAAVVFSVVAITLAGLLPIFLRHLPFHSVLRALFPIISWPIAYGFSVFLLAAIYAYGPNRPRKWHWLSGGSVVASALWLIGTAVFKWYVGHFGDFDRVYGNLGAIVGFLTWIWLSLVIILFGAELNRELQQPSMDSRKKPSEKSATEQNE